MIPIQVCELALVKLFDKLGLDELVISMCALLSVSNTAASTTPLNSSLHTPRSQGSVTVSSLGTLLQLTKYVLSLLVRPLSC